MRLVSNVDYRNNSSLWSTGEEKQPKEKEKKNPYPRKVKKRYRMEWKVTVTKKCDDSERENQSKQGGESILCPYL